MNRVKQLIISFLIIFSLILYIYGYQICSLIHNSEGLTGKDRQKVIHQFWDLRFSLYGVIVMIVFFVSRKKINIFNNALCSIGFSLAVISVFDKLILKDFDLNNYDNLLIFSVVFLEFIKYKINKKNGK